MPSTKSDLPERDDEDEAKAQNYYSFRLFNVIQTSHCNYYNLREHVSWHDRYN